MSTRSSVVVLIQLAGTGMQSLACTVAYPAWRTSPAFVTYEPERVPSTSLSKCWLRMTSDHKTFGRSQISDAAFGTFKALVEPKSVATEDELWLVLTVVIADSNDAELQ